MLQLFFKKSDINQNDWATAYQKIESIVHSFPLQLLRLESYDGFSRNQDQLHENLYEEKGTDNELISFYTDCVSFSGGTTVKFYKSWQRQIDNVLEGGEFDKTKPITWTPPIPFKNDGTLPEANGMIFRLYVDYEGALSQYVFLAIAIMLENVLPQKVFLVAREHSQEQIESVVEWLDGHFNQQFKLPLHFNKLQLLESFSKEYVDNKDRVCRMEHLYRKQYKRNMAFAIEHIGYKPSLQFYAEVLADNNFNTFGFADILDCWIAVTQDLEKALDLIAESKKILETEPTEYNLKKIEQYNLAYTLESFLKKYVLWTPQQREDLDCFYTIRTSLETGTEDLWGSIFRITGHRVNICPIYATENELFEAFMYHDPKNGLIYKQIIDSWIIENINAFQDFKNKLTTSENKQAIDNEIEVVDDLLSENMKETDIFLENYKVHERFFVNKALSLNPTFLKIEETIEKVLNALNQMYNDVRQKDFIENLQRMSKEEKLRGINVRLKDLRMGFTINSHFLKWLNEEENDHVLQFICLLLSWKMYKKDIAYARFRILWDRKYWVAWRN